MKSMSHFIQKTKKMKQPSLSGMMVTRINRLTKIRMAENGCFDSFERFHEFVTDYYEITVDKDLLRKLYMEGFLSDLELKQLIQEG